MNPTQKIVPVLLFDNNAEKATRVTQAMLKMIKLESVELQGAYDETS